MTIGETHEVDAATYFAGTVVTYTAVSSDTDAATVAVSNTSTVTVTGVAVGTATITVRATNLAGPTDQTFIVTVAADPDIPVITIAAGADATEGTDAVFTVTASPAPMSALDVSLTIGQTGDYVEVTNLGSGKTVTILANAASATYPVPTVGDSVHEPSGAVTATVTAGAGYTVGASNSDSVTVTNDDARPTLTFDVPAVTEGGKGTTAAMSFAVTSSGASTYLVRCWTQGGTADINVDYVGRNTNTPGQGPDFNISDPSQLSKMFDVTVNGDDIDEANESINTRCGFVGVVGYSADGAGTITDDDTAGLAFTPSSLTVNEGSTNTYRVALTSEPTGDVVVTPLSGDTTAVTVSGALTFTPDNWRTQQTVTLTGVVDTDTVGEVVTISHSAVGGGYDSVTGDVTATAIDSGGPVMFSIDSPSANEGTRALTFTVSLNRNPAGTTPQVSYRLATDSGTATGGADYIAANAIGTVHFSGSDTEATFTINVTNDGKDEADETIRIELHNPSGGTISATSVGVGTIVDDDAPPVVSVNWAETGVNEGQDMVFRVTLSEASGRVVTVKYDDDGTGTAMAGSADTDDYQTVTLTTVTFEPTNTSLERIVRVPTVNNAFDQDARTMVLKILDPVNATLNPSMSTATVTIADNDATPVIEVSSPSADEHGGTLDFVVSLRGESAKEIKVSYADAGTGTATVGQDYEAVTAGTLTFPAYTAASQTVSVTILDDTLNVRDAAEATSERVNLTFSNPLNAVFAGAQTTLTPTGAIRDNDLVLDTVIPDTTRQVGETFTFNLANIAFDADTQAASSSNTSVATTEVTGSGIDTMLTVTAVSEGTATITMTLSLSTTGGSVTDEFIFTVTPLSVITITAGSASVTEGAPATFTVAANPAPPAALTVSLTIAQTGGYVASGDVGSGKTVTILANADDATYTVATVNDDIDKANGTVTATLANGTGYALGNPATASVNVNDNDTRGVSISMSGVTVSEAGGTDSYTVKLDSQPTGNVTVTMTSNNAAATVAPPSLSFTTGNWNATQTVTVTGQDDAIDNPGNQRTATITHAVSGGDYNSVTAPAVSVTVTDDEGPQPVITITAVDSPVTEGAPAQFRVTANPAPSSTRTVSLTITQAGGYVANANLGAKTVDITTSGAVTYSVATVGDAIDKANGTVTATLANGTGYTVGNPATATVNVNDNDTRGVSISASGTGVVVSEAGGTAQYTVQLTSEPTGNVTVTPSVTGPATVSGAMTFTTGNWNVTQTVTVTGVDDDVDNPGNQRTATITHAVSAAGSDYNGLTALAVTVTVTDDEGPVPSVSITARTSVTEGQPIVFTITGDQAPDGDVPVNLRVVVADDNGGGSTATQTATIPANGRTATYTVTTTNDELDETGSSVTVTVVGGAGYTIGGPATAMVTVNDNDLSGVSIEALNSRIIVGSAADFRVTATTMQERALNVRVRITSTGVSGVSRNRTVTVTIPQDQATAVHSVAIRENSPPGTVIATLLTDTRYVLKSPSAATVTVADRPPGPVARPSFEAGQVVTTRQVSRPGEIALHVDSSEADTPEESESLRYEWVQVSGPPSTFLQASIYRDGNFIDGAQRFRGGELWYPVTQAGDVVIYRVSGCETKRTVTVPAGTAIVNANGDLITEANEVVYEVVKPDDLKRTPQFRVNSPGGAFHWWRFVHDQDDDGEWIAVAVSGGGQQFHPYPTRHAGQDQRAILQDRRAGPEGRRVADGRLHLPADGDGPPQGRSHSAEITAAVTDTLPPVAVAKVTSVYQADRDRQIPCSTEPDALVRCGNSDIPDTLDTSNSVQPPGGRVTLSGRDSKTNVGGRLTYSWEQTCTDSSSGRVIRVECPVAVTLSGAKTVTPSFTGPGVDRGVPGPHRPLVHADRDRPARQPGQRQGAPHDRGRESRDPDPAAGPHRGRPFGEVGGWAHGRMLGE